MNNLKRQLLAILISLLAIPSVSLILFTLNPQFFDNFPIAANLLKESITISGQFINSIVPLFFCLCFSFLGAFIKNLIARDADYFRCKYISENNITTGENGEMLPYNYFHLRFSKLVLHEKNNILLGMCMGVVGYFILKSKFLIRIFYPTLNVESAEITFTALAMTGLIFGYFARELIGISHQVFNETLNRDKRDENKDKPQ